MRQTKLIIAALLLISPFAANADLMRLDATSINLGVVSDFYLLFDDTGDGLLQWDEITSFSAVTITGNFWTEVIGVAAVPGISTYSVDPAAAFDFGPDFWSWGSQPSIAIQGSLYTQWTYAVSDVAEPGILALLGIGLFGMGLARRGKKELL